MDIHYIFNKVCHAALMLPVSYAKVQKKYQTCDKSFEKLYFCTAITFNE